MAVVTSNNMIKIFDISRRTYKQLGVTRKFEMKQGVPINWTNHIAGYYMVFSDFVRLQ